jgi:ABC-type Mn2+/Zn2+ transport system permease subunit
MRRSTLIRTTLATVCVLGVTAATMLGVPVIASVIVTGGILGLGWRISRDRPLLASSAPGGDSNLARPEQSDSSAN